MTPGQVDIATALGRCSYPPATAQKRFARNMAFIAENDPAKELSHGQKRYLYQMAHRYRRQMPRALVALAAAMLAGLEKESPAAAVVNRPSNPSSPQIQLEV